MTSVFPKVVALTFLASAVSSVAGVLLAWAGSQVAAWVRDASVLTWATTGLILWQLMRKARVASTRQ